MNEVWVYIQQNEDGIAEASLEVLGAARQLGATLGVPVAGVLAGGSVTDARARQVVHYGAARVYIIESPLLADYTSAAFSRALVPAIAAHRPQIMLLAATPQGRDLGPRLASALRVGLTADCTELQIGSYRDPRTRRTVDDLLLQIRPAWGGNIIATIVNPETRPQMATIREGIMRLPEADPAREGELVRLPAQVAASDLLSTVVRRELTAGALDLKSASVIVAGGAGMGSADGFQLLTQLAHLLGGQVAATRAAVDAGWIGHEHQVGQTGVTVRPKLYIACGISGAVQHLSGMDQAGKIVAVNADPEAPILSIAHYAIVGDVRDVVPRLIKLYRNLSH